MYGGGVLYGYLPKDIKEIVDNIVAEVAKDEDIAEMYEEWNKINREKLSLYYEKKEPDISLEDNKEFRSVKNDIIRAVVRMNQAELNPAYTPRQHTGYIFGGIVKTLLQAISASYLKRDNKMKGQIDGKLRSKIEQKKAAHGLKTDGSVMDYDEETQEMHMWNL